MRDTIEIGYPAGGQQHKVTLLHTSTTSKQTLSTSSPLTFHQVENLIATIIFRRISFTGHSEGFIFLTLPLGTPSEAPSSIQKVKQSNLCRH